MKKFYRKLTAAATAAFILLFSAGAALAGTLTLPSGLKKIEDKAFYEDKSFSAVKIPNTVTRIGAQAFAGTGLSSVVIPEGVTKIGAEAFADSSLTSVKLPASLQKTDDIPVPIADDAFDVDQFIHFTTVSGSYGEEWVKQYLEKKYPALQTGANSIEIPAGKTVTRSFTAAETGIYVFYTSGESDTFGTLYDSDMNKLASADDGSYGQNFMIPRILSAGEKIYVGIKYNNSASNDSETLMVEKMDVQKLNFGNNSQTIETGSAVMKYYIAPVYGEYTFYTTGSANTVGYLFDSKMNRISSDDDGGDDNNFKITYSLKAGETVYIATRYCFSSTSGEAALVVSGPTFRALLIGQVNFNPVCNRNWGDVLMMEELLKTVNGGQYAITKKKNLTKRGVQSAISTAFAGADDDDVSLILYASHGVTSGSSSGALCTMDYDISTSQFAKWLSAVSGKVIVLVGTCGSGTLIGKGEGEAADDFDSEAFNESLIQAFAGADTGLISRSGELAQSKFCVMTAAMGGEESWGYEGGELFNGYNLFAKWLYDGAGGTGVSMPADTNKENGYLTLNEWYTYVKKKAAETPANGEYYQHPQVYPENSDYVIFTK